MKLYPLIVSFLLVSSVVASDEKLKLDFETPIEREIPSWFNEDKFGIFVVWGPYSVPSFKQKGYAEWYWHASKSGEPKAFHEKNYGEGFPYENFGDMFKAELWDPDFWCDLFEKSGAKYVVTTANYHDGYAMYPTKFAKTNLVENWNSVERGPKRDLIGELNTAGEKRGLKMGIYYSFMEWYHPLWIEDREKFATEWAHPKFKEVVEKYKPWHIFLDGEWLMHHEGWKTEELAYWLYEESSVKDTVVVNDRWGYTRGSWGDLYESEYGGGKYTSPEHPWQEDRGIGLSYGYNRRENIYDYDSREELLRMFSGVVGGGGNFLLCVGPTGDGRIPVIMQERLLQVGEWLKINGDAVYGTTASPFWPRQFEWGTISKKPGKLFLHIHDTELSELRITGIEANLRKAQLLHNSGEIAVEYRSESDSIELKWPSYLNDKGVTIIELELEEGYKVDTMTRQFADGRIELNCWSMTVHGEKAYPRYRGFRNRLFMHDWTDPSESVSAEFIVDTAGDYSADIVYAAQEGGERGEGMEGVSTVGGRFEIAIGSYSQTLEIEDLGHYQDPKSVSIGTVSFDEPGTYKLLVKPIDDGNWNGFSFQGVNLKKR